MEQKRLFVSPIKLTWIKWSEAQKIPILNRWTLITHFDKYKRDWYSAKFKDINDKIQARLDLNRKPTFILVLIGHHEIEGNGKKHDHTKGGGKKYRKKFVCEFKGDFNSYRSGYWQLPSSLACKVRVFLEMCSADEYAADIAAGLDKVDDTKRPDYVIYSASSKGESAYAYPLGNWWVVFLPMVFLLLRA